MRRTGAWIVVAVVSMGCAAPAAPISPAPAVVTPASLEPPDGRVLEYGTLAPVSGAVVSFFSFEDLFTANAPKSPVASVVTDATGGYHVDLPPVLLDRYSISVDGVAVAAMTLRPGTPHGDFIVRAGNCSIAYGFVTDATTGAPLAGVDVLVLGRRATTSSRGWYLIEFGCNLPIGGNTTLIHFTREGYATRAMTYGRGVLGVRRFDATLAPQ